MSSNKIRAYIAHSIRGRYGTAATNEQMESNNKKAMGFGKQLASEFPNMNFYIPANHDEFVLIAYQKKYLTEQQILSVDCNIISRCNFLVIFAPDDYISKGMQVEIDHAVENHIPIISAIDGTYEEYYKRVVYAINCHLVSMLR